MYGVYSTTAIASKGGLWMLGRIWGGERTDLKPKVASQCIS